MWGYHEGQSPPECLRWGGSVNILLLLTCIRENRHIKLTTLMGIIKKGERKVQVLVAQLCLTVCNPLDCSPPGSSVLGILQARILEWIALPFSREFSQPRD